ncbi:hypothetical protein THRCLA_21257 [Thraustotheca clavata]|uniref:Secreted protein n=1 Tax=Thraustotheca clavata TaxID=74557 RepID=A0A1V9ZYC9_9STRA|nr:hypothetical protein THRCLA_21257 [Thraustotheca clavata]
MKSPASFIFSALGVVHCTNTTTPKNESIVGNSFDPAHWGFQRAQQLGSRDQFGIWHDKIDAYSSWLTTWGTVVNTRCTSCGGGRSWHCMWSSENSGADMLRNVQDNLCLDAWMPPGATFPKVYGNPNCDKKNINQQWKYQLKDHYNAWTKIESKAFPGMCVAVYTGKDAYMKPCIDAMDNEVIFHPVA